MDKFVKCTNSSCVRLSNMKSSVHEPVISNTWVIGHIKETTLQWGTIHGKKQHCCQYCHIELLTGENPGFCCGKNGKYANEPALLPPLPEQYNTFINDPHISSVFRLLNLIISFATLESSRDFPPIPPGGPSFIAMAGQLYHRIRPTHQDSAVRWLLYDGFANESVSYANATWASKIPLPWIEAVQGALSDCNPFARALLYLAGINPIKCPTAHICLHPVGPGNEIAAIMNLDNTSLGDVNT